MLRMCYIYNKFSISGPKSDDEWVPDLLVPHGTVFSGQAHPGLNFFDFLLSRPDFYAPKHLLVGSDFFWLTLRSIFNHVTMAVCYNKIPTTILFQP